MMGESDSSGNITKLEVDLKPGTEEKRKRKRKVVVVEANVGMNRNDGSDSMGKPVGETAQTEQTPAGLSRI
ncbi:hypothetical protein ABOM_009106 [Aspergillus bombycis]|uniref:Uncharacterized protein n=1 Tax=Aspergillus bombycis TaxID=109264 RepID=A0A1F7ZS82_9EURO|nr:hypothetical protein ABOM_009106 [Aspergillus bombycis]OGM42302.1 hypothetical protein ABOM_009106 [Aspergillus bombycis]